MFVGENQTLERLNRKDFAKYFNKSFNDGVSLEKVDPSFCLGFFRFRSLDSGKTSRDLAIPIMSTEKGRILNQQRA